MIDPAELQPFLDFLKSRGMDDADAADAVKYVLNVKHVRRAMADPSDVLRIGVERYCRGCDDSLGGNRNAEEWLHSLGCGLALAWCALEDPRGNAECGARWDVSARDAETLWNRPLVGWENWKRGAPAARRSEPPTAREMSRSELLLSTTRQPTSLTSNVRRDASGALITVSPVAVGDSVVLDGFTFGVAIDAVGVGAELGARLSGTRLEFASLF